MSIHRRERVKIIQKQYPETLRILKIETDHIQVITTRPDWKDMFNMIHHHRGRLFTLLITGPQLLRIFNGADWRDKLDWVVEAYKDTLKPIGFSPSSVGYMLYSLHWKEKIAFAKAHYIDRIACLGFSPFDFAILVTCGTWQEKIQYLEQHHLLFFQL